MNYRGRRTARAFLDNFVSGERLDHLPLPLWKILDIPLQELDDRLLEVAEHAAQAFIAAVRVERLRRWGARWSSGWGSRGFPGAVRRSYGRFGVYHDATLLSTVADHPYRLRFPDKADERPVFYSEPYHLGIEELRALVAVAEQGWHVRVDPAHALHYPGFTMVVTFVRRPPDESGTRTTAETDGDGQ